MIFIYLNFAQQNIFQSLKLKQELHDDCSISTRSSHSLQPIALYHLNIIKFIFINLKRLINLIVKKNKTGKMLIEETAFELQSVAKSNTATFLPS